MNEEERIKNFSPSSPEMDLLERSAPALERDAQETDKLLKDQKFLDKVLDEIGKKRVVGERENCKALLIQTGIALVKNRSGKTNHIIVTGPPSVGKDYFVTGVLDILPQGRRERFAHVSPTSLNYFRANDESFSWEGRVVHISDASKPLLQSSALKVFLSEEADAIVTNKSKDGALAGQRLHVKGRPVAVLTTAFGEPTEEMYARFDQIQLDESQEQTKAINKRRGEEAAGKHSTNEYDAAILSAVSKLQPEEVVIPYGEALANFLPETTRARRDVPRIFNRIKSACVWHQFQRQKDEQGRLIATRQDYEIARQTQQQIRSGAYADLTRVVAKVLDAAHAWVEVKAKEKGTLETQRFSADDLFVFKPVCSQRQLYRHLSTLAQKGLLLPSTEPRAGSYKPVTVFETVEFVASTTLPPFEELGLSETTIATIPTNTQDLNATTIATNTTNTPNVEGASVANVANVMTFLHKKDRKELEIIVPAEHLVGEKGGL